MKIEKKKTNDHFNGSHLLGHNLSILHVVVIGRYSHVIDNFGNK